ncbi:MAG: ATP-binding protein [Thermomicrobiales bacterium]|nr:ATP-binding protein [Thermomicrobiales bacterium]
MTLNDSEPNASRTAQLDRLIAEFGDYIDQRAGPIGRVVGSEREPAGSHQFFFWASDSARTLDVGHIVITFSEDAAVIGVVDEPRRFSDLRSFLDDYFDRHIEDELADEPPTRRPEILVFSVNVLATRHLRDDVTSHRPPTGGPVYFATPAAIDYATGVHEFTGRAIPALLHTNGNPEYNEFGDRRLDADGQVIFQRAPIWLDEDYLLGPEAGHGNWTGQSGLATKTSHVLFLISAIFQKLQRPNALGETRRVATLMFNVKGPDLLWLDKPAAPSPDQAEAWRRANARPLREQDLAAYAAMGLEPNPFEKLQIFAPFKPGAQPNAGYGQNATVHLGSEREVVRRLNTLRNRPEESANVHPILWDIGSLLFYPHKLFEFQDLDDKLFGLIYELRDGMKLRSLQEIQTTLGDAIEEMERDDRSDWRGHHKATVSKARNRFNQMLGKFGGLLTDGKVDYGTLPKVDQSFEDHEVRVVDIAHCNTNVQEVLVSSIIGEVWKMAEEGTLGVDKVIVFVDELNKYATSGSQSALRNTLVDIAARGRHLNVVLFGAQQFRSKVDDEILGNCGTSFYGRVGDEEITNASYRSLSENTKTELLGLPKGRLLARHAHFRSPLFGEFPLPPSVAGSAGQRLFNDAGAELTIRPAEALFLAMQGLGETRVSMAEVSNYCDGLSSVQVTEIISLIETEARGKADLIRANRFSVWAQTKKHLIRARSL